MPEWFDLTSCIIGVFVGAIAVGGFGFIYIDSDWFS